MVSVTLRARPLVAASRHSVALTWRHRSGTNYGDRRLVPRLRARSWSGLNWPRRTLSAAFAARGHGVSRELYAVEVLGNFRVHSHGTTVELPSSCARLLAVLGVVGDGPACGLRISSGPAQDRASLSQTCVPQFGGCISARPGWWSPWEQRWCYGPRRVIFMLCVRGHIRRLAA